MENKSIEEIDEENKNKIQDEFDSYMAIFKAKTEELKELGSKEALIFKSEKEGFEIQLLSNTQSLNQLKNMALELKKEIGNGLNNSRGYIG